jgi:hypothetical protein
MAWSYSNCLNVRIERPKGRDLACYSTVSAAPCKMTKKADNTWKIRRKRTILFCHSNEALMYGETFFMEAKMSILSHQSIGHFKSLS